MILFSTLNRAKNLAVVGWTLVLFVLLVARAQECETIDSCVDCVNDGCAWFGACGDECAQEVGCVFNTFTPQKDCNDLETASKDNERCATRTTCRECNETPLLSDGSQTCTWYEGGFCSSTCDNDPCLELSCSDVCTEEIDTCVDCVSQGCAWFGGCFPACAPDVTCVFESNSPQEDCDVFERNRVDNMACLVNENCTDCRATPLPSDSSNSCTWFDGCDGTCNYCAAVCDGFRGCEEISTCSGEAGLSCAELSNCTTCATEGCAWSGACNDECTQDTGCVFNTTSPQQDCTDFETTQADNAECATKTTCSECTETPLPSDDTHTCSWFDGSFCSSTCELFDAPCVDGSCSTDVCTGDIDNCFDCVTQGCAWFDVCGDVCPADVECLFNTTATQQNCTDFETTSLDNAECLTKKNCTECSNTPLPSDASKTCAWYDDSFCSSTCGPPAFDALCVKTPCSPDATTCIHLIDSCVDCVTQGCAWSELGVCAPECAQDIGCVFDTDTPQESCDAIETSGMDQVACRTAENCEDCTSMALPSDSTRTCTWFKGCDGECDYCGAICNVFTGCDELTCSSSTQYNAAFGVFVSVAVAIVPYLLWW